MPPLCAIGTPGGGVTAAGGAPPGGADVAGAADAGAAAGEGRYVRRRVDQGGSDEGGSFCFVLITSATRRFGLVLVATRLGRIDLYLFAKTWENKVARPHRARK